MSESEMKSNKSKTTYALLGIFLGAFGTHNFYAGFTGRGIAQLLITILSCGMLFFISWIWAVIEVLTTKKFDKTPLVQPINQVDDSQTSSHKKNSNNERRENAFIVHNSSAQVSHNELNDLQNSSKINHDWEFHAEKTGTLKHILAMNFSANWRLSRAFSTNNIITIINEKGTVIKSSLEDLEITYSDGNGSLRDYVITTKNGGKMKLRRCTIFRYQMKKEEWIDFEQKLGARKNKFVAALGWLGEIIDFFK